METAVLIKKIKELPEDLQLKAEGYIDSLLEQAKQANLVSEPDVNRGYGSMKGLIKYISDDFDAPLEDFKDYM
jgi:hypothetical protein